MPPKSTINKERLDRYYYLAKEQGYRSRASFKLIQLNKKYDFLSTSRNVLDLCAAPGGWCQVARKFMPMNGVVLGVDLASIKNIPRVQTLVGDITLGKTAKEIKQIFAGQKLDLVLNDGSPNVGSNWLKDAYTQIDLVLHSLKLATQTLKPHGLFITKVFRSKDYNSLLWVLNQFFEKVEATKPKASRHTSAEIYIVCRDYKAPKEIDSKLFDPNFIFEEVSKKKDINFKYKKKIRNRDGYEDGNYILFKKISAKDFVNCDNAVTTIAENGAIVFDEDETSQIYLNQPETTTEIKILCSDTQVLGRFDFRELLKWRQKMIHLRDSVQVDDDEDDEDEDLEVEDMTSTENKHTQNKRGKNTDDMDSEEEQEAMKEELLEYRKKSLKVSKNLLKRKKEKLIKRMPSAYELTQKKTDVLDNYAHDGLFALKDIGSTKHLEAVRSGVLGDEVDVAEEEKDILRNEEEYREVLEASFDAQYDNYLSKKPKSRKRILTERKKKRDKKDDLYSTLTHESSSDNNDEEEEDDEDNGSSSSSSKTKKKMNPLIADDKTSSYKSKMWFSQNIFNALKEEGGTSRTTTTTKEEDEFVVKGDKSKKYEGRIMSNGEFLEVPQELHDEDVGAVTLALAKKLLRKKERREFIDNAYNRYAFNDEGLPKWFTDDELRAYNKMMPITKEEVMEQKKKYELINNKPMKKVLEAKFRNKKREQKKKEQVKDKATQIAENVEMTNHDKAKELMKLYKSAKKKNKNKVYVVSKSNAPKFGSKRKRGAVVKYVDPRMKTEKRAEKKRKLNKKKRK